MTRASHSRRPVVERYNPHAPRTGPGVYTLDDIKDRCRVDAVTGCWHWAMASRPGGYAGSSQTPSVSTPTGVIGERRRTLSVGRVVWMMQGRPLQSGWVVWRTCGNEQCCAPAHLRAGTKAQAGAWLRQAGYLRDDPRRRVVNTRNCAAQAVPVERVRLVQEMLAAGVLQREIAARTGIHKATISKIATGKHMHCRPPIVRGASVFSLGGQHLQETRA